MTVSSPRTRRRLRHFARVGAVASAVMLAVTGWSWVSAFATGINAGTAQVVDPSSGQAKGSGGSSTDFSLKLPQGAACKGDSANDGYRVQSYMVGSSVDPSTLQFGSSGPTPTATGASFREPLFQDNSNQSPYVNQQTAAASPPPGPGPIINIPAFFLGVFSPGQVPAGTYNVGIACTLGSASATQLDRYWNVQMTIATSASDSPAQITWTVASNGPPTTSAAGATTTSSTTAGPGGTTTTAPGGTTSTTAGSGGTTTTIAGSGGTTTTTTQSSGGTTTTTTASGGASVNVVDAAGNTLSANAALVAGQQYSVTATGFVPAETVTIAVHSATVTLGTAVADSTGKVTASIVIPTSLDAGAHTLTLTGAATTASFPFTFAGSSGSSSSGSSSSGSATSSGSSGLPRTGSDPLEILLWAALLLAFGRIAVLLGRPIRARRTDA